MAEPFLGEIRIFPYNQVPTGDGWAQCNGQLLPINQNQALFSLLGTTYGGDGRVNFALPNLQARVPIHEGSGHTLGEQGGQAAHTLIAAEMPTHTHQLTATSVEGTALIAGSNLLARSNLPAYHGPSALQAMAPESVSVIGGSQAHTNLMPSLALTFCIALQGIFPSQT
jgi:microcystin-dependent protein